MSTLLADTIRREPEDVRIRALATQESRARGLDPADLAPIRAARPTTALAARRENQGAVLLALVERGYSCRQLARTFGYHRMTVERLVKLARSKRAEAR